MRDESRGSARHQHWIRRLPHAEVTGDTFVAMGDHGGMTYFTVPAPAIACSAGVLIRLMHEVDALLSSDPDAIQAWFVETVVGEHLAGGTGGAWMTGTLWVHDEIRASAFANRIAEVLAARRPSVWPGGSDAEGTPERPADLVELLETETGDAPADRLLRRAVETMNDAHDPSYEPRLRTVLHRFLRARNAGNRIEAAKHLVFAVPSEEIAEALRGVAAGEDAISCWHRDGAVALLGRLARCGAAPAWRVLAACARSDGWIADHGPHACGIDWDHRYREPAFFREALAKMEPT